MSRRKISTKREIIPDPVYQSEVVAKFINHVMVSGKRSVAEKIVYGAFSQVLERHHSSKKEEDSDEDEGGRSGSGSKGLTPGLKKKTIELFEKVLVSLKPTVEVRSRRVGGSTYQIPVEVPVNRQMALAMRWLVDAAKSRSEKGMLAKLAAEMLDVLGNRGAAVKKREDTYRMAKANQAFAHYRW